MIETSQCWMRGSCKKPQCDSFCIKLFKMDQLYTNAQIPLSRRSHTTLRADSDGTDEKEFTQLQEIISNIEQFVQDGTSLYIHSVITGNGKTSWAKRAIEAYFNRIWWKCDIACKALFVSVPRYLLALKSSISKPDPYVDHVNENILDADLVVMDEIGIKAATPFEMEHLLNIVNTRMDMGKSTIFTSNLTDDEMVQRLGDRLYSRISKGTVNIELHGQDKRGT